MAEKAVNPSPPRKLSISFVDDPAQLVHKSNGPSMPQLGERRQSMWQAARKSIYTRRVSHSLSQGSRKSSQDIIYPKIRLQNTYRTEPNENEKFKASKIEPRLYAVLEKGLKDKVYDANKAPTLSKELSQDIMRETRLLMNSASPRYKLVSHVIIGEIKSQDLRFGSRCLWDNNLDNVASASFKNDTIYAVATIYAIYFE